MHNLQTDAGNCVDDRTSSSPSLTSLAELTDDNKLAALQSAAATYKFTELTDDNKLAALQSAAATYKFLLS